LKILYIYQYFGTPKGSWSTRVYELTRRWVEQGHDVTVITAPYEKSDIKSHTFISHQEVEGIRLIVINSGDSNRLSKTNRVFRALLFSVISTYFVLRTKANVVIASSGPITVGIPGLAGKFFKRIPLVFEVRDLWPDGGIEMGLIRGKMAIKASRWFECFIYKNSGLIVTASIGQEAHIKNRYPSLNYLTIPNASDLDLFAESDFKSEKSIPEEFSNRPLFLHIGSLGFIHNCFHILKAAKDIKEMGFEKELNIVFIGEGSERMSLEFFVRENNLKNVHFMGLLPKQDLPKWLHCSTATLFTTLNNPVQDTCSPNKIFDSFAAGVPIIQTTQGWIKELVKDNYCGVNVDPNDTKEMAGAMIYLIENKSELARMKHNSSHLANTGFNRDVLAEIYLKNLEAIQMIVK
jgi:glycosyltransferase involved in cell wall biosynthesis